MILNYYEESILYQKQQIQTQKNNYLATDHFHFEYFLNIFCVLIEFKINSAAISFIVFLSIWYYCDFLFHFLQGPMWVKKNIKFWLWIRQCFLLYSFMHLLEKQLNKCK